jgi:hypothetical protein
VPDALATQLIEVLALPRPHDLRRHVAGMNLESFCDRLEVIYRETLSSSAVAA